MSKIKCLEELTKRGNGNTEKEEQEEYLKRLEEANKASKAKEKTGMGGSIARGSGAARAQQFRKNG